MQSKSVYGAAVLSFNDEIAVAIARMKESDLIHPEQDCLNDSKPVGEADFYLQRLYTLWQLAVRRNENLEQKKLELIECLPEARSRAQKVKHYKRIEVLEGLIARYTLETNTLEHHFWAEAYRRIRKLSTVDTPIIASDWHFYGPVVVHDSPETTEESMLVFPESSWVQ